MAVTSKKIEYKDIYSNIDIYESGMNVMKSCRGIK